MTFWDILALAVAIILIALGASCAVDRKLAIGDRVGVTVFTFGIAALLVWVALA